jgi:hypothetical protein
MKLGKYKGTRTKREFLYAKRVSLEAAKCLEHLKVGYKGAVHIGPAGAFKPNATV